MISKIKIFTKPLLPYICLPIVIFIRLIRPILLIRIGCLPGSRIGHLAANTEMYLCEQESGINKPNQRYIDLFYIVKPISNEQLKRMWQRILIILPAFILAPIKKMNQIIPGGLIHEVGDTSQSDRDINNLLDNYPVHLTFTEDEELRGKLILSSMGVTSTKPFVCIFVRDNAYLKHKYPNSDWEYHNYRDSDIQNYVFAAEEIVKQGYYVIRMGEKVNEGINTESPSIIDYAANGMRSDFMDIYLAAKCSFVVTTGSGWDSVPAWLFRKPVVFTNSLPIGLAHTSTNKFIFLTKKHLDINNNRELTLREIFKRDVAFCLESSCYTEKGVKLIENTPQEIRDIVLEMIEWLNRTKELHEQDLELQYKFYEIYEECTKDRNGRNKQLLHGDIHARYSLNYLINNEWWLN